MQSSSNNVAASSACVGEHEANARDEYDLDGVTAKLAAMEAKRKKWHDIRANNSVSSPTEQVSVDSYGAIFQGIIQRRDAVGQQLTVSERAASGFELIPADSSSEASESDDDQQSDSTNSLPSAEEDSRFDRIIKRREGRGRMQNLRVKDSLDLSMSVSMTTESFKSALRSESAKTNLHPTGSRIPRRQPAVVSRKPCYEHADRNAPVYSSRIPKLVQQHRRIQSALQANTDKRAQNVATKQEVASHGGDSSIGTQWTRPISAPIEFQPSHLPTQRHRHERPPEGLHAPSSTTNGIERRPSVNSTPSGGYTSARDPPKEPTARLKPAKSPVNHLLATDTSMTANKPIATKTVRHGARGMTEDVEVTSAEEQKLLQSLEKLDRRLSNVSASPPPTVRVGDQQSFHRDEGLLKVSRQAYPNSGMHNAGAESDEPLRAAAHGEGTHCKLRQPTASSVRSSFLKREELSSGVHKSRVRVGGALVHGAAGRTNGADGSGKHKVVVKKDMAHLLF